MLEVYVSNSKFFHWRTFKLVKMKLRFVIGFYFLLLQFAKVSNEEIDVDLILPIMEYFNVLHPIIIDKTNTTFQEKWVFLVWGFSVLPVDILYSTNTAYQAKFRFSTLGGALVT